MTDYPLAFWLACGLLFGLVAECFQRWREPWAKQAIAVYVTVTVWYPGNLVFSTPAYFKECFPDGIIEQALWQVTLFCVAYRVFLAWLLPTLVRGLRDLGQFRISTGPGLNRFFAGLVATWAILLVLGLWSAHWQILAALLPPLAGWKADMYGRGAIGGGIDFLLSTGGYLYCLTCAFVGIMFVLCPGMVRMLSFVIMFVSWPAFFFGHSRHIMLSVGLPALLAYLYLSPTRLVKKVVITGIALAAANAWFLIVMDFRTDHDYGRFRNFDALKNEDLRHQGVDMLSELCYINDLMGSGAYQPNFGERYYAEIATVVPRTFWPSKPKIGWDYALARGFGRGSSEDDGVNATIATGMIGQGVVNFGGFFGVLSSSLLMALWTGFLARLWLQRAHVQRAALFLVGIGLTFNMGRDITLTVLFPFVFGYIGIRLWEFRVQRRSGRVIKGKRPQVTLRPTATGSIQRKPLDLAQATVPFPIPSTSAPAKIE